MKPNTNYGLPPHITIINENENFVNIVNTETGVGDSVPLHAFKNVLEMLRTLLSAQTKTLRKSYADFDLACRGHGIPHDKRIVRGLKGFVEEATQAANLKLEQPATNFEQFRLVFLTQVIQELANNPPERILRLVGFHTLQQFVEAFEGTKYQPLPSRDQLKEVYTTCAKLHIQASAQKANRPARLKRT